jgi:hypothetical protein
MGAFLLGMFLVRLGHLGDRLLSVEQNGAAIWGFDSILQTADELRRDAALGSDLPEWTTSSLVAAASNISWAAIPASLVDSWTGFGLSKLLLSPRSC